MSSATRAPLSPQVAVRSTAQAAAQRSVAGNESVRARPSNDARFSSVLQLRGDLKVSSPSDPAEKEAEAVAQRILRTPEPSAAAAKAGGGPVARQSVLRRSVGAAATIARKAAGPKTAAPNIAAEISGAGSGTPLPAGVRRFMESRFRANFGGVRIHVGAQAAALSRKLSAQAFTVGNQIFFGKDRFNPDSAEGKELLAHELTHTIQQGAALQRREDVTVSEHAEPQVQRLGMSDVLDFFADKANMIPGYRMFTIVLGVNPINMSAVERSAANILRAIVEFMPGGGLITQALDKYGVFDKVGGWIEQQLASLGLSGASIKKSLTDFVGSLGFSDLFSPGSVWDRAKRIFSEPVERIISFVKSLASKVIDFIKDAILRPLAELASKEPGWDLLCAVIGKNPITGESVPRNAETLIGGFMKLIGQEEIWENIKKGNAIARAFAWFEGALSGLLGFVRQIPALFLTAVRSLEIADIVLLPRAFMKIGTVFGGFASKFFKWAGDTIWDLLEIIFSVVAPAVLVYLKKARDAFKKILKDPIGFVGNLIKAGKQGLNQFVDKFPAHLRKSLIDWLTGSLGGAGVYIPQAFSLVEIGKCVLSILGVTWTQIRGKIVRALGPNGEFIMRGLETSFAIVKALVTGGPAAAWEVIKQQLTDLRDTVLQAIIGFVKERVITKAVTMLISMLNPAGAFIQAVLAIYNGVMAFVERLKQIAQVVAAFIDSISAIANGVIGAAANRVEQTLGGLLTLVISFLARIVGLGNVSAKVVELIKVLQAKVDVALDRGITWIVAQARRLFASLFSSRGRPADHGAMARSARAEMERTSAQPQEAAAVRREKVATAAQLEARYNPQLQPPVRMRIAVREPTPAGGVPFHIHIGPNNTDLDGSVPTGGTVGPIQLRRPGWIKTKAYDVRVEVMKRHRAAARTATGARVGEAPTEVFRADGTFRQGGKWARRHILSSFDMKRHYENVEAGFPRMLVTAAATLLTQRGAPPASPAKSAIQPACQALLAKFHNDVTNLWVGDTRANSSLQENVDASPEMYERPARVRLTALEAHIQRMANAYGIPGARLEVSSKEDLPFVIEVELVGS